MYIRSLEISNIRSVAKTRIEFETPSGDEADPRNVTLILGDNGTGKTTFLGAIALGCLAEILDATGFRPYYLVRRPDYSKRPTQPGRVTVDVELHEGDGFPDGTLGAAGLEIRPKGSFEMTHPLDRTQEEEAVPQSDWKPLFDDKGEGFLLLGYGATRRTDQSESFDPSTIERSRANRYHRVAGLFEDQLALTPLAAWLPRIWATSAGKRVVEVLNATLPDRLKLTGVDKGSERSGTRQLIFESDGTSVPFWALSDGYRAFVGLVGDILYHMWRAAPKGNVTDLAGVVLIDELDLHLHPSWQRTVVGSLSHAFPRVQFVITTHSAIVAGTVPHERMFVLDHDGGSVVARPGTERIYGRSAEEILLSGYFGLRTTRAPSASADLSKLSRRAMDGDDDAALQYLRVLAGHASEDEHRPKKGKKTKKKGASKKTSRG